MREQPRKVERLPGSMLARTGRDRRLRHRLCRHARKLHRHLVQPSDPPLYRPGREPQPVAEQSVRGLGLPTRRHGHESFAGHDQHAHADQPLSQSRDLDVSDRIAGDPQAGALPSSSISSKSRDPLSSSASHWDFRVFSPSSASLWLAFLLFPPFNFVYGLQGWLATNPPYGHTLALSNLILVAFIRIGAEVRQHPASDAASRATGCLRVSSCSCFC